MIFGAQRVKVRQVSALGTFKDATRVLVHCAVVSVIQNLALFSNSIQGIVEK